MQSWWKNRSNKKFEASSIASAHFLPKDNAPCLFACAVPMCGVHTSLDASVSHCQLSYWNRLVPYTPPTSRAPRPYCHVLDWYFIYIYIIFKQKTPSILEVNFLAEQFFGNCFLGSLWAFALGMETRGVIHGHFAKLTSAKNFLYPSITEFPLATASSMPLTCHEKPNIVVRNIRCQWGVEQYDSYYPGPWKY